MCKLTHVSRVGLSRKSLLQRDKLEVTLLTHRSYNTMGCSAGQETGARAPPPGFFLSLCHMKSGCLVLEGSQAAY